MSYEEITESGQAVDVNLTDTLAQYTGAGGIDLIINVENVTGSAGDDTLTGDNKANVLKGNAATTR